MVLTPPPLIPPKVAFSPHIIGLVLSLEIVKKGARTQCSSRWLLLRKNRAFFTNYLLASNELGGTILGQTKLEDM